MIGYDRVGWCGYKDLSRGYGYSLKGNALTEGIVRYDHQGGGQEHTSQLRITYNNTIKDVYIAND